jgi:hypothetical protein
MEADGYICSDRALPTFAWYGSKPAGISQVPGVLAKPCLRQGNYSIGEQALNERDAKSRALFVQSSTYRKGMPTGLYFRSHNLMNYVVFLSMRRLELQAFQGQLHPWDWGIRHVPSSRPHLSECSDPRQ